MKIIRKFLGLFTGQVSVSTNDETHPEPIVVPRDKHVISRKNIDQDALKVLNRLNRFNHTAYLVGGGVRDLLLERKVKDFDIATSAHPHEIKKLFRNCRLIGRRFRLAHILFRGRKVIEVSTFRKHAGFSDNGDLLIKSDNAFGTAEEDARRRDFTVNGLFYNSADYTVIDYVGGLKDLEAKVISTIGDPDIRFREDPIRMLRAIRFAARLGFTFDAPAQAAMERHHREIWKGAVPRILDEILRMLHQGAARESFQLLHEAGALKGVLPRLSKDYAREEIRGQVENTLLALDRMKKPKEGVSSALLMAALYFPSYRSAVEGAPEGADRTRLAVDLLKEDLSRLQFPRAQFDRAKLLMLAQNRLESIGKKRLRPSHLVRKSYFDEALALFEIVMPPSKENQSILRRWRSLRTKSHPGSPPDASRRDGETQEKSPRRRRGSKTGRRKPAAHKTNETAGSALPDKRPAPHEAEPAGKAPAGD